MRGVKEKTLIYAYPPRGRNLEVYVGDEDGFFLKATEKILGIGDYSGKVRKYRSRYSDEERGREEYEIGRGMEIVHDVIKYTGKNLSELVEAAKNIRRKTASMLREQKLKQSKIPSYIFSIGTGVSAAAAAFHFGAEEYSPFIFIAGEELIRGLLRRIKHRKMVRKVRKILEEENIPLEIHKFWAEDLYDHEILLKLRGRR